MRVINSEDMKIIIDSANRVVICELYNCEFMAISRIHKYIKNNSTPRIRRYLINNSFTGVAKCDPEDVWDVDTGIAIAMERAKKKRNKAANAAVLKYVTETARELENLADFGIHEWGE